MKKFLIIGIVALAAMVNNIEAQTVPTPPPVTVNNTDLKAGVLQDIKQLGGDAWAALKDANFANGVNVEPFGIYHSGDFGGGLAVTTASTNGVNVGFAVAAIDEKVPNLKTGKTKQAFAFYDATLSIQLGRAVIIPVINLPAYLYVEAGPAVNLKNINTVLEQSIAGAKVFFFNNKLTVGAGVGQNSEWTAPFYILHIGYAF